MVAAFTQCNQWINTSCVVPFNDDRHRQEHERGSFSLSPNSCSTLDSIKSQRRIFEKPHWNTKWVVASKHKPIKHVTTSTEVQNVENYWRKNIIRLRPKRLGFRLGCAAALIGFLTVESRRTKHLNCRLNLFWNRKSIDSNFELVKYGLK